MSLHEFGDGLGPEDEDAFGDGLGPEHEDAFGDENGVSDPDELSSEREAIYAPAPHWPLNWHGLVPQDRWMWFAQLWGDVCRLRDRYRLPVRSGWWEDPVQVETLAALVAWSDRYDSGEWDDPPGKLALLYDLERISVLLRDGNQPFHPARDRMAFECYLIALGCDPVQ